MCQVSRRNKVSLGWPQYGVLRSVSGAASATHEPLSAKGSACCTDAAAFALQKAFFITSVAVFSVLCALLAVTMRYRGDTSLKPLSKGELKKRVLAHLQKLTEDMIRAEKAAHCKNLTKEKKAAAKRKPKKQIEEEMHDEAAARLQKRTKEDKAAAKKKARKQIEKEHEK